MNSKLQDMLDAIEAVEPFPSIAIRVLEQTLAGEPDPLELALVVKLDVGITAKVLRLANSAGFSTLVEIESIEQAAVKLGSKELMRMVMTSAAHSFYSGLGASTPRSNNALWVESATNAIAAKLVAQDRGRDKADLSFTAGLLMNMGHVVLDRFLRSERDEILGRLDSGMKMLRAERDVVGLSHPEIGARMARKWNFPETLVDLIENHHSPDRGVDKERCADLNLAEALTWETLGVGGASALAYGVSSSTIKLTGVNSKDAAGLRAALPTAVDSQLYLLALE